MVTCNIQTAFVIHLKKQLPNDFRPGKMKYVSTRGWCDNTLGTLEQSYGQEVPEKK